MGYQKVKISLDTNVRVIKDGKSIPFKITPLFLVKKTQGQIINDIKAIAHDKYGHVYDITVDGHSVSSIEEKSNYLLNKNKFH
jgi:hypothetical protein